MIRPALPADLLQIRAIARAAYAPYVARNGLRPAPLDADYGALLAQGTLHVVDDGGLRGFAVLLAMPDHLLLDNIAVHPAAQGKGFGRMLMDFAETQARGPAASGFIPNRSWSRTSPSMPRADMSKRIARCRTACPASSWKSGSKAVRGGALRTA